MALMLHVPKVSPMAAAATGAVSLTLLFALWRWRRQRARSTDNGLDKTDALYLSAISQPMPIHRGSSADEALAHLQAAAATLEASMAAVLLEDSPATLQRYRRVLRHLYATLVVCEEEFSPDGATGAPAMAFQRLRMDSLAARDLRDAMASATATFDALDGADSFVSASELDSTMDDSASDSDRRGSVADEDGGGGVPQTRAAAVVTRPAAGSDRHNGLRGVAAKGPRARLPGARSRAPETASARPRILRVPSPDTERVNAIADDASAQVRQPYGDLYAEGAQLTAASAVACRQERIQYTLSSDLPDFLARVHCVRVAGNVALAQAPLRAFLALNSGRILSALVAEAGEDVQGFQTAWASLVAWIETLTIADGAVIMEELRPRGVVALSFFDCVLDFILLDAFQDLERPPETVKAILASAWMPQFAKASGMTLAIRGAQALKARGISAGGYLERFYAVMYYVAPTLARGLLSCGPPEFCQKCLTFKGLSLELVHRMFSNHDRRLHTTAAVLASDMEAILVDNCQRACALVGLAVNPTPTLQI